MSFNADIDEIVAENRNRLLGAHPSWKRVRLREVAVLLNGFPFESAKFRKDKGTPLLRIRDVVRGQTETFYEGDFDRTFLVQPGELVVGMDGDFNSALWRGEPALLNQRVCKITTESSRYSPKFLEYVLPGYLAAINAHTPSVTVKHLSSRTISDIPLPHPPLDEQQRIVAEIEKQFTRLDSGVASLKRVEVALKRYRASVLKAACEGRLVPTEVELFRKENRSYETGEQLLQRILKERNEKWEGRGKYKEPYAPDLAELPSLPAGWCWLAIDAIAFVTKLAGFEYTKFVKYDSAGDRAVIKAENAGSTGFNRTDFSRVKHSTVANLTRSQLMAGDLLMVFVGNVGNVARVPDDQPYFLGPNIGMIRVNSADVSSAYLEFYLRSPSGRARALGFVKAVAQPSLSMGTIRMIPVAIPPLAEQQRIVAEVERRLSVIDDLEAITSTELRRATRLRQSILQKAFSGSLATTVGPGNL